MEQVEIVVTATRQGMAHHVNRTSRKGKPQRQYGGKGVCAIEVSLPVNGSGERERQKGRLWEMVVGEGRGEGQVMENDTGRREGSSFTNATPLACTRHIGAAYSKR